MQVEFPSSFLWGVALSSYQAEGGNFNTDWFLWEKEKHLEQASSACCHYQLFEKDFRLARQLNLNSLRLSIEWARVMPSPTIFLDGEIEHYQKVIDSLIKNNLKPIVTLHHFTNPIWFVNSGGWANSKNIDCFLAYLKKIVESLKDEVDTWLIFNEPLVYIYNSFICGIWPPGEKSIKNAKKVLDNITIAYIEGYKEIKNIYKQTGSHVKISIAKSLRLFCACPSINFALNSLSAYTRSKYFNFQLLEHLSKKNLLDFIGLNYYCKEYVTFKGLLGAQCSHKTHKERQNHLGWDVSCESFYKILLNLKRFNLPIMITENGTAETKDELYEDFLLTHLQTLARAYREGVNVIGYLWWSLLDNFEWDKGFKHRFGLLEVDYDTYGRTPKPFAYTYSKICKENKVNI